MNARLDMHVGGIDNTTPAVVLSMPTTGISKRAFI